ncbi:MAG: hypothetical protein A2X11_12960 [Bacteroidetes bacterium GWE2_42_24]|nr:MAG: hypothetical protein A2X11_12960 [Bacteroidetes bacterium GWE2_42_24]OFY32352.1 MAG: hypothetical protein A2X09_13670 [Bacteroidetes bacterium GWF2_43_11]PKP23798.1 MAG: hypothetical protein CVU06_06410 [Bacteroidetes bacterium HGW-Bacteroidetes-22]HCT84190.1 hypothetical protein [Candidatus Margulisiibacteriota bacterium]
MNLSSNPLVCLCASVTRKAIIHVIKNRGARSIGEVRRLTGANTGCRKCTSKIEQLLAENSDELYQLPVFPND